MPLTLLDYKRMAFSRGYKYILNYSPSSVDTSVEGWECLGCETIYDKSHTQIKRNGNCKVCIPKSSGKKTLEDYQNIGKIIGIEWTLKSIPTSTEIKTKGFRCSNGHILEKRYKDIRERIGCAICGKRSLKILEDYQELGKNKGIEYILDYSPKGVNIMCENAWKCK